MQDDRTVAIPLTKKSSDEQYTRFVGEYVDETYLQLLADNPDSGSFSISELDAEELFIPQTYTFNNFALAYASNVDDEDFKERIKKRAEQEAKDRYLYLENLFGDTSSSGSELSKTCEGIDASLQAFENEIKQRVKEGTLTEAERRLHWLRLRRSARISARQLRAPIDADDTWIAAIDDPYFTGEDPDIGEYSIPTDAEIDGWYAGQDAATIKEVKDFFHRMKESIDNNYACGKLTNRSIRNSLDAMGTSAGIGKVSASGSPSA